MNDLDDKGPWIRGTIVRGGVLILVAGLIAYFYDVSFIKTYGALIVLAAIISIVDYLDVQNARIDYLFLTLESYGLVRQDGRRFRYSWLFRRLPKTVEIQPVHIRNFVRPFCQPPILSQFSFSLHINKDWIATKILLSEEELRSIDAWETTPTALNWKRWSGGHEQATFEMRHMKIDKKESREYGPVSGSLTLPRLWKEKLGEGTIYFELTNEHVRLALIGGRFGYAYYPPHYEYWKEPEPKQECILIDLRLKEKELKPFEELPEEPRWWDHDHGRPVKQYESFIPSCGGGWWLTYYHDLRPLAYGTVKKIEERFGGQSALISFDFDTGHPREVWKSLGKDHNLTERTEIYIAFDTNGEIDCIWPAMQLSRDTGHKPVPSVLESAADNKN